MKTSQRCTSPTKKSHNLPNSKKYQLISDSLTLWNLEKLVHLNLRVQKKYLLISESLTKWNLEKLAHLNLRVQKEVSGNQWITYNLEPRDASTSKNYTTSNIHMNKANHLDYIFKTAMVLQIKIWHIHPIHTNEWVGICRLRKHLL